jgi:hypothetical protein
MSNIKAMLDAMNEGNMTVFPQKENPKKFTISINDGAKRYFLTRTSCGLNEDGTPKYQWAKGQEMRKQEEKN